MTNGNGKLKYYATLGTLIATAIVIVSWIGPKVMAVADAVDRIEWLGEHREQYPVDKATATAERAELRKAVLSMTESIEKASAQAQAANKQALVATALSSANQELLYELLKLEHRDRGLPPPKRRYMSIPSPGVMPPTTEENR